MDEMNRHPETEKSTQEKKKEKNRTIFKIILSAVLLVIFAAIYASGYIINDSITKNDQLITVQTSNNARSEPEILFLVIFPMLFAFLTFFGKAKYFRCTLFGTTAFYTFIRCCFGKVYSTYLLAGMLRLIGHGNDANEIMTSLLLFDSFPLGVATVLLFVLMLVLEFSALWFTFKYNERIKRRKKERRTAFILICSAAVFLIFALIAIIPSYLIEKEIDENTTYCKGFQIFETDKGSELSDFNLKKSSESDIFGWGPLDYTPSSTLLDTGSEWRETNISGVKKGVNILAGEYSPKKRYVLLLPFYESDSTEWVNIPEQAVIVDTKKNSELKTVLKIAVGDYETTIKLK